MKINPFEPFAPVNPGSFVGRLGELRRLKSALLQTGAGKPVNFMITGERGIGKTSLLNYLKHAAEGRIQVEQSKLSFVVVDTDVDQNTTQLGLIAKIELGLERALAMRRLAPSSRTLGVSSKELRLAVSSSQRPEWRQTNYYSMSLHTP